MNDMLSPADESFKSGFVTLVGRPNAGKSTLLNAIMGKKIAITSNTVQTTGENALSPTHELVRFYVDLYVDEQGYFRTE